jgi:hypothetical protein
MWEEREERKGFIWFDLLCPLNIRVEKRRHTVLSIQRALAALVFSRLTAILIYTPRVYVFTDVPGCGQLNTPLMNTPTNKTITALLASQHGNKSSLRHGNATAIGHIPEKVTESGAQ